jgi:hypothetical protein
MAKKGGLGSILGDVAGAYLGDQFGGSFGLSPQMGATLGGALGGGLGGGNWESALGGAATGYLGGGGIDKGINSLFSGVGSLFGGGQPTPMSPAATPASLAQAVPDLPLASSGPGINLGDLGTVMPPDASPQGGSISLGDLGSVTPPGTVPPGSVSLGDLGTVPLAAIGDPTAAAGGGIAAAPVLAAASRTGNPMLDKIMAGFTKNPLQAAALIGGIAQGLQPAPYSKEMSALAAQEKNLAAQYGPMTQDALQGKLPAAAEAYVQRMIQSQKAAVQSNYASMGMSGSSAEAQDLSAVESSAEALRFQIGQGIAQQAGGIMQNGLAEAAGMYGTMSQEKLNQMDALTGDLTGYLAAMQQPQYRYVNGQWVLTQ